nr:MAG TPA: protein of unknown function (DUF4355) [Caudoviricetes sp.]
MKNSQNYARASPPPRPQQRNPTQSPIYPVPNAVRGFVIPDSAKAAGTTLSAKEGKPMENTTDQEATDGAQAPTETSTDTAVQDTAPADTAETSQEATQDEAAEDWKAHARTWERRAKADHKQLEALMETINGKDTTIEELRSQVAALEAQAHRAKLIAAAASEYGVPADLIHGDTEDEIKQIAQRLADWRGTTATPAVPALADSGAGVFPPRPSSLSLDEQITAAQTAGDFKLSARLKAVKLAGMTTDTTN